jgi:hypothetical protein
LRRQGQRRRQRIHCYPHHIGIGAAIQIRHGQTKLQDFTAFHLRQNHQRLQLIGIEQHRTRAANLRPLHCPERGFRAARQAHPHPRITKLIQPRIHIRQNCSGGIRRWGRGRQLQIRLRRLALLLLHCLHIRQRAGRHLRAISATAGTQPKQQQPHQQTTRPSAHNYPQLP